MMKMSQEMKINLQNHFGYSEQELQEFLSNTRNNDVLSKALSLAGKTIVVEVVDSHGCNSQHVVGTKFYFDGAGNLLTKLNPKKICIFALAELDKLIYTVDELIYAGIDPNNMRFNRAGCCDVGLKCGGWGHIVMEIHVEDRK